MERLGSDHQRPVIEEPLLALRTLGLGCLPGRQAGLGKREGANHAWAFDGNGTRDDRLGDAGHVKFFCKMYVDLRK